MKEKYILKSIPHVLYEGDIHVDRLTPEEIHQLADKFLKQGFDKIKQKYAIIK